MPNSENVIKSLNRSAFALRRPGSIWSKPDRRAFINDIAFTAFAEAYRSRGQERITSLSDVYDSAVESARAHQSQFTHSTNKVFEDPTLLERTEVMSLFRCLVAFKNKVIGRRTHLHFSPRFKGCGILDSCAADMIAADILIEVKAGDRNFRSPDIRQVLTYCVLNQIEKLHDIRRICFVNPRRALYALVDLDTLCLQLSSKSPPELLSEIEYFLSSGEMSL